MKDKFILAMMDLGAAYDQSTNDVQKEKCIKLASILYDENQDNKVCGLCKFHNTKEAYSNGFTDCNNDDFEKNVSTGHADHLITSPKFGCKFFNNK